MRRRPGLRAVLALLLALLAIALRARDAEAAAVDRTIEVDGRVRSYRIHVPDRRRSDEAIAVLLVFHGAGSDVESMVRATGFEATADRERFLVVYPRALAASRRFDVGPASRAPSPDVRFVRALLERLTARFRVDARRVYATGFSNGGAFCYRLAAEMPGTFAAVAPVAAHVPPGLGGTGAGVRVLHAHGTRDARIPLDGALVRGLASWASAAGCSGPPTEAADPSLAPLRARRAAWTCPAGAEVVLLVLDGVGHAWPGGPDGPLSRAVWAFLAAPPAGRR